MYTSFDNIGLLKVLSFLKSHKSEYLSGQDLSDVLKISRVAVWKHIKKIRELGYEIESKQKRGYRYMKNTERLLPWEISVELNTDYMGKRSYYFEEIDSTQNFALQIASNKKEHGTIIIAQKQTDGKGRLNRKWICSDLSKIAIQISRERLVKNKLDLNNQNKKHLPFELLKIDN